MGSINGTFTIVVVVAVLFAIYYYLYVLRRLKDTTIPDDLKKTPQPNVPDDEPETQDSNDENHDKSASSNKSGSSENVTRYESLYNNFNRYVNQNLNQDKGVYTTTVLVIIVGMVVIISGTILLIVDEKTIFIPLQQRWVVVAAGVITEFIAATILVVYRTVNKQTLEYFRVLQNYVRLEGAFRIIEDFDKHPNQDPKILDAKVDMGRRLLSGIDFSGSDTRASNDAQK
jgi:Ca2+/Na+ antiporter